MPGPLLRGRVPLISWVRAGHWDDTVDIFEPGIADERIDTTAAVGPHAFALRVRGDSMTHPDDRRSLPDGAIVICDPALVGPWEALHNRIVVAKRTDDQQATLKLLWFDGGTPFLRPLNPRYPMLACPPDTRIVAVAKRVEIDL